MDCIQLEMNFNGRNGNTFRSHLDNGEFQILCEVPLPSFNDASDAERLYRDMEYAALSARNKNLNAGLAFLSGPSKSGEEASDLVSFASGVCKGARDSHVIYLSGRGMSSEAVCLTASQAVNEGFKNFCCVSGGTSYGEREEDVSETVFAESVGVIDALKKGVCSSCTVGCVVNPYKYTATDSYAQYFKLVKKINHGANFAVCQYGWDVMKLQELRWYLFSRALALPSFARIMYLSPARAKNLLEGKYPGMAVSPDLEKMLRQELELSGSQFEALQLRRIQLHAAGARLLGYSGIQLSGVNSPELLETILNMTSDAEKEFTTFEEWLNLFKEYYERLDMAPYPYKFYMFENMMKSAHPDEGLSMTDALIPPLSASERLRYKSAQALFSHADELPASDRKISKKLTVGCRSCSFCRLPETQYVCPELCPKGLANGTCGETLPDGKCPFNGRECIYDLRVRMANEMMDYVSLEETCVETPKSRG